MDPKQALGMLETYTRKMALTADEHEALHKAVKALAEKLGMIPIQPSPVTHTNEAPQA